MANNQWTAEQYKEAILRQVAMEEAGCITKRLVYLHKVPVLTESATYQEEMETLLWKA